MVANLIIQGVLSVQTICKLEGGGGRKYGKFANVIYEYLLMKNFVMVNRMGSTSVLGEADSGSSVSASAVSWVKFCGSVVQILHGLEGSGLYHDCLVHFRSG